MPVKMHILEEKILEIIKDHPGKDNPITVKQLENKTYASSRMIRKAVANLVIKYGIPIASSVNFPYGFYLIADKKEAEECLRQYWSRVREISNRAQSLNKAVKTKFNIKTQYEFSFKP